MRFKFHKSLSQQEEAYINHILKSSNPDDFYVFLLNLFKQMAKHPEKTNIFIDAVQNNKLLFKWEIMPHDHSEPQPSRAIVLAEPPLSEGRRVDEKEYTNGTFLRREYVPCKSSRCKKRPDLHGPYWYSYRRVNGKWVVDYHGKLKPIIHPVLSHRKANDIVNRISKLAIIEEDDIHELRKVVSAFAYNSDKESKTLQNLASSLIERERIRRDNLLRERHHRLFSKVESGHKLTKKEQEELSNVAGILAGEH